MKIAGVFKLTLLSLCLCFAPLQAQWTSLTTGVSDDLYGMYFIDDISGFAVGWGVSSGAVTIRTFDGGETWQTYEHPDNTLYFGVTFSSFWNGYIAGYRGGQASLLKTTDAGGDWDHTSFNGSFGFYEVEFPTEETGYVCGYDGAVFKTEDAGETWNQLDTGMGSEVVRYLRFVDEDHGWAFTGTTFADTRHIYRTTDGGETWDNIYSFNSSSVLTGAFFLSPDSGFVIGNDGNEMISFTADSGATWQVVHSGPSADLPQSLHMIDNRGWAAGTSGRILHSTDRGQTWELYDRVSPGSTVLLNIQEANGVVFASAWDGRMYKHEPIPSAAVSPAALPVSVTLHQNFPNPFNPVTTISYDLTSSQHVTLQVMNSLGRAISTLVDSPMSAGTHSVDFHAKALPSGPYFYSLQVGDFSQTRRMLLLK